MTLEETKIFQTIAVFDGLRINYCKGWDREIKNPPCTDDYKVYKWPDQTLFIVCSYHDEGDNHKALLANGSLISSLEDLQS